MGGLVAIPFLDEKKEKKGRKEEKKRIRGKKEIWVVGDTKRRNTLIEI